MRRYQQGLGYLLALSLLLGLAIPLTSCRRVGTYSATFLDTFDTVLTVTVGAKDRTTAEQTVEQIHTIVKRLHDRFDIYNPHTYADGTAGLYEINHAAGRGEALAVDADTLALLRLGETVYARSNGQVNMMMGAVLRLWHDARTAGDRLPAVHDLQTAMAHSAMDSLVIEKSEAGTGAYVSITDPAASLDVGAIAKGYVMDCVLAYAQEAGVTSLLVNLGGHVLAVGNHPDGDPWRVSIPDPREDGTYVSLEVTNASVVTSGDYERVFTVDGVAYHHLIDPATAYPATAHRAVTVILPHSLTAEADGYSTALFLLSQKDGEALLEELATAAGEEADVIRAIWFSSDGRSYTWSAK